MRRTEGGRDLCRPKLHIVTYDLSQGSESKVCLWQCSIRRASCGVLVFSSLLQALLLCHEGSCTYTRYALRILLANLTLCLIGLAATVGDRARS